MKNTKIGTLNITIQPHNEDRYIQLFEEVFKHRIIEKYYGDKQGIISKIEDISEDIGVRSLRGNISIFTKIDVDGAWFDIKSLNEADDKDLKEINIPENLKPNLSICNFIFDAHNHKMYFLLLNDKRDRFSPKNIEKIMFNLFNQEKIVSVFGDVAVSLVPEENTLEKLLSYPQITQICMRITPPNPDDLADEETKWMSKLTDMGAKNIEQKLTVSTSSGTIRLDEETKKFAQVANTNGFVKVVARDAYNNTIEDSTKAHPKLENMEYDADVGIWPSFYQLIRRKFLRRN